MGRSVRAVGAFALALLVGSLAPRPARGDAALDQAKTQYAAGLAHFEAGKYREAVAALEAAYALKPIPKILMNLGQTHLALGDKAAALEAFRRFLRESRNTDPDRAPIEQQVAQLAEQVPEPPPEPGEVPEPPTAESDGAPAKPKSAQVAELIHTPVDEVGVRKHIQVVCELPPRVAADRVSLFFRAAGEAWETRKMDAQGYAFIATIPSWRVTTSSVQYYIEATHLAGKPVAVSGSKQNPHIVVVRGGEVVGRRMVVEKEARWRTHLWTAGGLGVALVGAGVTFAMLAQQRESRIDDAVRISLTRGGGNNRFKWDERGIRDFETEGRRLNGWANTSLVVGGISLAAAGLFFYLDLDRGTEEVEVEFETEGEASWRPRLLPVVTDDGAGLLGQVRW